MQPIEQDSNTAHSSQHSPPWKQRAREQWSANPCGAHVARDHTFGTREYFDAIEAYRHRSKPGHWVLSRLAACYAQLGRMDDAAATVARVLRLKPDFSVSKLRRAGWGTVESEHVKNGMRKAGLPE